MESILFFCFAGLAVLAGLFMVWTKNVIHAAYGLAAVLLCVAALFVLLNAEFLAVVQIFMYAGGIIVLLVFGIMLTNREKKGAPMTGQQNMVLATIVAAGLTGIIIYLTVRSSMTWTGSEIAGDQTKQIGKLLITDHLIAFELIAVLLLAVLVGAAFLAKKSTEK